ncbi:MAG TPA: hypothetical protein VFE53_04885 [Mucilaginibacter sp.]|jgi:hypothetical protein|nr:hypothetical protein [Mucilaginibacter sp.]
MASNKLKVFLLGFLLSALSFQPSHAQSFADWFEQGKTLIKNLEQQVAALNACETGIRQGYTIFKTEWGSVTNFKNAEFGLHQGYYNSLSRVNPNIKNTTDITTIEAQQQSIINQFNTINSLSGLTSQEQVYIGTVQQQVIAECAKDLTDLQTALTPGQLVLSDDERIKRINKVSAAIKDKYVFTCSFANQVRLLTAQRNQDTQSIQTLNQLYGIN